MKEKTTIHVWLLLLLTLAGIGGAGWYAHAASPAITGLMPVLGDAYGPFTQHLSRLAGQSVPGDSAVASEADIAASHADALENALENAIEEESGEDQPGSADAVSAVAKTSGDANTTTTNSTLASTGGDSIGGNASDNGSPSDSPANASRTDAATDVLLTDVALTKTPGNESAAAERSVNSVVPDNADTELLNSDRDATSTTAIDEDASNSTESNANEDNVTDSGDTSDSSSDTSSASESVTDPVTESVDDSGNVLATLRETELSLLTDYADSIEFTPEGWALNERARDALSSVFETLFIYSDVNLQIDVHVFDTDDAALNQVISEQRASTMRSFLLDRGLGRERVEIIGRGDTVSGDTTSPEGDAGVSRVTLKQLDGEN